MTTENTQSTEKTENTQSTEKTENTQSTEKTDSGKGDSGNRDSGNRDSGNRDSGNRDVIYIGKKPLMAYVTSTLIQLANLSSVRIKARGMSIGRAVDVTQIISRKTENAGYVIGEIKLGSEALESQDGKMRNVSTIEIEVRRK